MRRHRRHVAWGKLSKQQPRALPQPLIPGVNTQNPITSSPSYSMPSSIKRINKFQAMLAEQQTQPPQPPPPKYTKSSKHFLDGIEDDGSTVDEYIDRQFHRKYPYGDIASTFADEAAIDNDEVKRSQMNQKENTVSKIWIFFNKNGFHLNEYHFSRSTIQFLGALCQQGKIQYSKYIFFIRLNVLHIVAGVT